MSTRIDDDDWFAAAQHQAVESDEPRWDDEFEPEFETSPSPDLVNRQGAIVLSIVVAGLLVVAGVIIGRVTTSSTARTVTVAAAPQPQTAPTTSAPGTTTPSASAGTPSAGTKATTPGTGGNSASPSGVPTGATLQAGSTGSAVLALQKALVSLGYSTGAADANYGAATAHAVSAFQTSNSLPADGVAGPKTLAAINTAIGTAQGSG
jgi:murein L,D-transpeptidase YcbB/YkuD